VLGTGVPGGKCYDIPIALQDRAFNEDGSINFPNGLGQTNPAVLGWNPLVPSAVPNVHPQWIPEYFGDVPVVNGVAWPKMSVEPRAYRFRLLGGSNARCWVLGLSAPGALVQPRFTVIATEQGYVPAPVPTARLHVCPGERYDVVVDFSALNGQSVFVTNSASAPYPNGTPPAPGTPFAYLSQVMRFDVVRPLEAAVTPIAYTPPATLSGSTYNTRVLPPPSLTREMVLNEVLDAAGAPVRVQIDGKPFEAPVTETPKRGTVEVWKFVNTTVDAHPIHLHLVQFKVLSRQKYNARAYGTAIGLANLTPEGGALTPTSVRPYLIGAPRGPDPFERGWKDTVRALPGEVTTVMAHWDAGWDDCDPVNAANTPNCQRTPVCQPAPAEYAGPTFLDAATSATCICEPDGTGTACAVDPITLAPVPVYKPHFEPVTAGPYVWHCHIVDHEDNEMMRPSLVIP
jgi:FtsP/CotA-like multicopper oxidase with cupredoxin domain